jgi:hypothetical protein
MLVRWKLLRFRAELEDCLFLLFSIWVSAALYLWWLGFYSDDWAFLGTLTLSDDQSLPGLIRTFFTEKPDDWVRPVKGLYHVVLYSLFGLQPLGFHLVNTTVLMLGVVLFYLVLRELNQEDVLRLVEIDEAAPMW